MIICHIFQKWVSWNADTNTALPGWARKHHHICPACQAFYSNVKVTESELSRDAERERKQTPPFLQGKIMASIRTRERSASQPATGKMGWALAAGAACVLVAGVFTMRQRATPPVNITASRPVPVELSLNLPTAVQLNGWTKSLDAPLENEMQLVLGDAQAAMVSLKQSLLPENIALSSPGQN